MDISVPRRAQQDFNSEEHAIVNEIENFAAQGFRTLMFAKRELESAEGISDGLLS